VRFADERDTYKIDMQSNTNSKKCRGTDMQSIHVHEHQLKTNAQTHNPCALQMNETQTKTYMQNNSNMVFHKMSLANIPATHGNCLIWVDSP